MSIKVYRIENQEQGHGIWRNFDGSWNPVFDKLSDGQVRNSPMEDNSFYSDNNEKWFASAPSKETLKHWFSSRDVDELQSLGYEIFEFEVDNYREVSEFEYVFTRASVISQTILEKNDIWKG